MKYILISSRLLLIILNLSQKASSDASEPETECWLVIKVFACVAEFTRL